MFRKERRRVQKFFTQPSLTKQSFKDECDINNIMKKYQKTGLVTHLASFSGQYGDFTSAEDYHASFNKVLEAQDMFMTLPSSVRSRFENDPAKFLEFVHDPKNQTDLVKLGLAKERPSASPLDSVGDAGGLGAGEAPIGEPKGAKKASKTPSEES